MNQPKEFGTYSRGDNIFIQINIKDVLTNALSDPSDVSISIINPCNIIKVASATMSSSVTGVYTYDYAISSTPTNTPYGIYKIEIKTETEDTLTIFNFVVFPWDVLSRIREISGAFQQSDMSDYKLALLAWTAYEETLDEVFELHYNEKPLPDPDSGYYFNGINIKFQLKNTPIADHNGDDYITGFGELACGEDITFSYIDSTGNRIVGDVTVIDANNGLVELTDIGGGIVPNGISSAQVTYYSQSQTYNKDLMREAVAYLTAHKALLAFKSLDKATLADMQSNRATESERFLKRYEEIIEKIGFPNIGCGK